MRLNFENEGQSWASQAIFTGQGQEVAQRRVSSSFPGSNLRDVTSIRDRDRNSFRSVLSLQEGHDLFVESGQNAESVFGRAGSVDDLDEVGESRSSVHQPLLNFRQSSRFVVSRGRDVLSEAYRRNCQC